MAEKKFKTYSPFGIATKRFAKIGFHPELDVSGALKKEITKVGPGSYNPKYPTCKSKRGMCWKTKVESEVYSKFLNYKNAYILQEREFYKTLGGPGTNDVNEDFYRKKNCSILDNNGFGTGKRFKYQDNPDSIPPPDAYFRNLKQTSTLAVRQLSKIPTFEWDGFVDRFKSTEPNYTLAPNLYHIQSDKGIDAKLKKVVSLRGPYDLSSGPRDETTIKNYFSPSSLKIPDYFYVHPSDIDVLLSHPSKANSGRFLKEKRFTKKPTVRHMLNDLSLCYRDPDDPGPASYDLSSTQSLNVKKEALHPFDTCTANARVPPNWAIFPGPGRYIPKAPRCMKLKRPSWVFLSNVERKIYNTIDYRSF